MITNDYLMRRIEQIVRAIADMLKLSERGEFARALHKSEGIYDMLGVPKQLIDVMDAPSLARLLRTPDKMRMFARVCQEEASIHKRKGDPLSEQNRNRLALELHLEARAIDPHPEDRDAIASLVDVIPRELLPRQYRATESGS